MNTSPNHLSSRRDFLKTSALAGGVLAAPAILPGRLFAKENSDTLRVGLVGCGGRGSGAADQALNADKNVILTAMADAFDDRLQTIIECIGHRRKNHILISVQSLVRRAGTASAAADEADAQRVTVFLREQTPGQDRRRGQHTAGQG